MELHKSTIVSLKTHPELNEKWLQDQIVKDTTILGLGDLVVRSQERSQPKGGRLDLLLEDPDSGTRYEVELQLGTVDESHIIRTIEYWDLERRRYPQYDHVAVIVAEEITSRFFNVIGLFNGFIPLIAIQLNALEVGGLLTLNSTRVLDVQNLGTEEEDSPALAADRAYWESRSTKSVLSVMDQVLDVAREIDSRIVARYNRHYVGVGIDGLANNFISFRPRKKHLCLQVKIPMPESVDERLENTNLQLLDYNKRWNYYRIQMTSDDIVQNRELLVDLMKQAYELRNGS
jgi:predicted transport protein